MTIIKAILLLTQNRNNFVQHTLYEVIRGLKRKVIRGGSWKDVAYYLQNGTRSYEYQDSAKSYIGFRNARTYLGRDVQSYDGY